jgi:hypothetical protein
VGKIVGAIGSAWASRVNDFAHAARMASVMPTLRSLAHSFATVAASCCRFTAFVEWEWYISLFDRKAGHSCDSTAAKGKAQEERK